MSVDTLANPRIGTDAASNTEANGYFKDQSTEVANQSRAFGKTMPDRHQAGRSVIAPGSSRAPKAGVTDKANSKLVISITITQVARLPRKSPDGPSKMAIGVNASTVVAVALTSGTVIRVTACCIASSGSSPPRRRFRISSVTTMDPSTSSPRATTSPVMDS